MMLRLTPQENPIDRLLCIAEELRLCLGDIDQAQWLLDACQRHIEGGASLDRSLGLTGTLGRSPRFEYLRRERNRHLAEALRDLYGDFRLLADEIQRYELRVPRAWRHRKEPAPDWTSARVAIHAAFRVGIGVPATADGLKKTLAVDE